MKNEYIIITFLFISFTSLSQVAINTTTIDNSAALKVESNDKGILIPRVALISSTDITTVPNPTISLLIYNTATAGNVSEGYYFWNGNYWDVINSQLKTYAVAKYETTNSSTNINQTLTSAPVFGSETQNDLPAVFVQTGNQLQVMQGGRYSIALNIRTQTSTNDSHPIARIAINGTPVGAVAGSAHVEVADDHRNSSFNLYETFNLNGNDIITIQTSSIESGSTTMVTGGASTIIIIKLK